MNKAFRRSLLSLTAASAMASSAFAGNAAYVDVKVNYLNSGLTDGKETVILGIDDDKESGKQRDRVEILVTLLDKDGEYATKDENGKTLQDIELKRGDTVLDINPTDAFSEAGSIANISNAGAFDGGDQHKLYRAFEEKKNITRFVLDYSNFTTSKLEDVITVKGGSLTKDVTVVLSSKNAEGLIVRVTNKDTLKATQLSSVQGASGNNDDDYLNEEFSKIGVTDDNNLNIQSNNFPTAVAGDMIPIRVYASTQEPEADDAPTSFPDADKAASNGRFTLAPNLEGKTIVVQAVADYKGNGDGTVVLNSTEIIMSNGVASGEIKITQGLPGSNTDTNDGAVPDTAFTGRDQGTGLGVAFVAYVKDDVTIANLDDIDLDNMSTVGIIGDNSDTDALVVRSGDPKALKVGHIYPAAKKVSELWKKTNTNFYLMDVVGNGVAAKMGATGNGVSDDYDPAISGQYKTTIVLTVVDEYDNPAYVTKDAKEQYLRFEGYNDDNRKSDRSVVVEKTIDEKLTFSGGLNFKGGNSATDQENGAEDDISNILSINISDSADKNGSSTETLLINFADTALSGTDTIKVKINTVEPIKSTVSGNPVLADLLNISTTTIDGGTVYSAIKSGLEPLGGIGSERGAKFIHPEFKAKLKITAISGKTAEFPTMKLLLSMKDPEDSGKFTTSDYYINYTNGNAAGYKVDGDTDAPLQTLGVTTETTKITGDTFEFNVTSSSKASSITISKGATKVELAKLAFKSFNRDTIEKLKGNTVNITFKAYHDNKPPVYVETYIETEEEPIGTADGVPVGSVLNFKFSGEAIEGDEVVIDFNMTGSSDNEAHVILEGEELDLNDESNQITTTLNADRMVSVVLYESSSNNPLKRNDLTMKQNDGLVKYGVRNIQLNGLPVIYKTQQDDEDTKERYEVGLASLFGTDITVTALETIGAAKVNLRFESTTNLTHGSGDGSEDEKQVTLPSDVANDIEEFGDTTKPKTTDKEVQTNLYYGFFTDDVMTEVLDKYDNFVNTEESDMEDNFIIECSSGMTCNMESSSNQNKDSYIYFKPEAVGTTQTITFKVKDNEKITNSISFSNIRGNAQNTKFNITRDLGHATFNVVNTETIIKIVGDGGKAQEETKLVAVSDNKDAKVKLIPLGVTSKFFRSIVNSKGEAEATINGLGNYYVLSSDKPGKVTVTASGTIKKSDSNTKDEVALSGSGVVNFVAVDLDKPVVGKENVKISSGGLIVTITDANLDIEKTVVEIKGINDDGKQIAKYSGNNTYTATKLPIAVYQIVIKAYDLAGNFQEFEYVRQVKEGVAAQSPAEEVAKVLDGKEYSVDGTFEPYDFGGDKHLNWAYHESATDKWYQLLGDKQADKNANPFGWKMVEIDPNNKDADKWYMVKLTGAPGQPDEAGKFGWAMVKSDLSVVKKIAAVKANGSFEYVNVEITAKMAKDKIVFSLAKASK